MESRLAASFTADVARLVGADEEGTIDRLSAHAADPIIELKSNAYTSGQGRVAAL
jgi:hypothetical protein